ncbi:hypothetical protein PC119_g6758, partial [Phytophthora cactorum]
LLSPSPHLSPSRASHPPTTTSQLSELWPCRNLLHPTLSLLLLSTTPSPQSIPPLLVCVVCLLRYFMPTFEKSGPPSACAPRSLQSAN